MDQHFQCGRLVDLEKTKQSLELVVVHLRDITLIRQDGDSVFSLFFSFLCCCFFIF